MEIKNKNIFEMILNSIFSILITNLGIMIIKEFPNYYLIGLTTILLAFLFLYFSYYILEIREHKKRIEHLEDIWKKIDNKIEVDEELLNTLKDIILLKNEK